ncbi:hypothetical protein ACLQ2N_32645 [Streptomyces sp. DT224]
MIAKPRWYPPGSTLPSSARLADLFKVSVDAVTIAKSALESSGYVLIHPCKTTVMRNGSGQARSD